MSWEFKVGKRVVCVRPYNGMCGGTGREVWPIAGVIYTLRDVGFIHPHYPTTLGVRLMEIANEAIHYRGYPAPWEPAFAAMRFRPVEETRLDQFRAHLNPITREVETA